jgi:hypothetical protein
MYVIDTLYDHANDIQKHVFKAGYVIDVTRDDVNDIPTTCHWVCHWGRTRLTFIPKEDSPVKQIDLETIVMVITTSRRTSLSLSAATYNIVWATVRSSEDACLIVCGITFSL